MQKNVFSQLNHLAVSRELSPGWMGLASFLESTVLPIPLEALLIPYYQTHRKQIWRTATVVTLACLLGAAVFYIIGGLAAEKWGNAIVGSLAGEGEFDAIKLALNRNGFLLILLAGVSPIPFQLAMLAAGAVEYSFLLFLLAAALARSIRYFGLAWLVQVYGNRATRVWKENKWKAMGIGCLVIAILYILGRSAESVAMR